MVCFLQKLPDVVYGLSIAAATDLDAEVRRLQSRGRGAAAIARALGRGGFDSDTILAALHRAGLECPFPD